MDFEDQALIRLWTLMTFLSKRIDKANCKYYNLEQEIPCLLNTQEIIHSDKEGVSFVRRQDNHLQGLWGGFRLLRFRASVFRGEKIP